MKAPSNSHLVFIAFDFFSPSKVHVRNDALGTDRPKSNPPGNDTFGGQSSPKMVLDARNPSSERFLRECENPNRETGRGHFFAEKKQQARVVSNRGYKVKTRANNKRDYMLSAFCLVMFSNTE